MMVKKKLVFFGALALVLAGAGVGIDISPVGGAVMIVLGGVLLCQIMFKGE